MIKQDEVDNIFLKNIDSQRGYVKRRITMGERKEWEGRNGQVMVGKVEERDEKCGCDIEACELKGQGVS